MQNNTKLKPVILLILDGFGHSDAVENNAIAQANTPNLDAIKAQFPHTLINASEHYVGLPDGQMGNSEVGHLNIGAGRIVFQDFERINNSIASGEFLVDSVIEYKVSEKGRASVTNTIKINNQKSIVFPKGYSLTFNKYSPINLKVYENGRILKTDFSQNGEDHNYLINFENLDVGIDTSKVFLVTYEIDAFANKTGDTWEVNIPYPQSLEKYTNLTLLSLNRFGLKSLTNFPNIPTLQQVK